MSYSVLENNGPDGKTVYVADDGSDLNDLKKINPPMGTSCLIIATGQIYILNSQKNWIEI